MRQILVDHARRKRADKRGAGVTMMSLDDVSPVAQTSGVDVLALDEALDALSSFDVRQCRVVELRFFAGLNIDEAAEALDVSTATVEREWVMAKAWLHRRLSMPVIPAWWDRRAPRFWRGTTMSGDIPAAFAT